MKELFKKTFIFIRINPTIVSSVLLIFVVIGFLFLNSYITLVRFQDNVDKTLRSKAVLAEDILGIAAVDLADGPSEEKIAELREKVSKIKSKDSELTSVSLLRAEGDKFVELVGVRSSSSDISQSVMQQRMLEDSRKFATSTDESFAFLSRDGDGQRFWNVVKALRLENGTVQGILEMKLSLAESDDLTNRTITQVYLLSLISLAVVLGLVLNHIRLFAFEVKAKKLEEIDKMKDDFISMASHELKSPLTSIKGYAELLGDLINDDKISLEDRDSHLKYLKNINLASQRLGNLIDDMLSVSKIEQGRWGTELVQLDVYPVVEQVLAGQQLEAVKKGIQLVNSLPQQLPMVNANSESLKQIMLNLIGNAVKYTEKGNVEVSAKFDEQWLYVTVADSGIGISAENIKKLFSKFYRIKNARTSSIPGTGLGLWISREVACKMGGEISVESIEGVGSHFTLKLKKAK